MPKERIQKRFQDNDAQGRRGLLPYITASFPDPGVTAELIRRADRLGVTAIEIGIPYSDSIADGPVIQSSFNYVLEHGYRLSDTFDVVQRVRGDVGCGLVAMVSYSIVHRLGLEQFMGQAALVGFDGVILPDVPVEESGAANEAADGAGMCHIGLVAPTTRADRRDAIARQSTGFIYQIAVAGLTGERDGLSAALPDEVAALRRVSGLPVCVGFGISKPEHVRRVCAFADGAIVGSAIVRRIADAISTGAPRDQIVESVSGFIGELMAGTNSGS
jgi:tryptophan synthase alpha chain